MCVAPDASLTVEPDVYGQNHPHETDNLIRQSLREFDEAVDRVPAKKKENLSIAQCKCPELLTNKFKLMFLRCEVFRIECAAKRYAKYWDKRVAAFGPVRAFEALSLSKALCDDAVPLALESIQIIHRKNDRDILYFDPSKLDRTLYSRESAVRAFWYFFHSLLEDEEVQKRGVVILMYNANFSNRNRDPALTKLAIQTMKGSLPIRMSAIHGCHTPGFYGYVVALCLMFLGERLRKRVLTHSGDNVMQVLQDDYGISEEHVPTDMGGKHKLDIRSWLKERTSSGL